MYNNAVDEIKYIFIYTFFMLKVTMVTETITVELLYFGMSGSIVCWVDSKKF